jgi:hypothetical protein
MEGLTAGRIVHYVVTGADANEINRRRDDFRLKKVVLPWPGGAQAHVGNPALEGDHFPAIVVWVLNPERGYINAQVFLDGNDSLWITTRPYSDDKEPGTWHWIEKA